jgi:hypothetical protein
MVIMVITEQLTHAAKVTTAKSIKSIYIGFEVRIKRETRGQT